MFKAPEIKAIMLIQVYLVLLMSLIVPHHHHEEIACYTSTHCEDVVEAHQHPHSDESDDHQHDHEQGKESQHCISVDQYVVPESGKSVKRVLDYLVPDFHHTHFLTSDINCAEKVQAPLAPNFLVDSRVGKNTYTFYITSLSPLRAPPALLT
jgi:hypothetical protein